MQQLVDVRYSWDAEHQVLTCLENTMESTIAFKGYIHPNKLDRCTINVVHTLPRDSLRSLNTDYLQQPGALFSCGANDRVLLATTNLSSHGYHTVDELKKAVSPHIAIRANGMVTPALKQPDPELLVRDSA